MEATSLGGKQQTYVKRLKTLQLTSSPVPHRNDVLPARQGCCMSLITPCWGLLLGTHGQPCKQLDAYSKQETFARLLSLLLTFVIDLITAGASMVLEAAAPAQFEPQACPPPTA